MSPPGPGRAVDLEIRLLSAEEKAERAAAQAALHAIMERFTAGDADGVLAELASVLGLPRHVHPTGTAPPKVLIFRWMCLPEDLGGCDGTGRDPAGGRCLLCAGAGMLTADKITDPEAYEGRLRPAPTPPAVMRRPCGDCALRRGSPEDEHGAERYEHPVRPDVPFFCHHGMHRRENGEGGSYESPAYVGTLPLGAMLCAGWWALATGAPMPDDRPYREMAGADRTTAAPTDRIEQTTSARPPT